MKKTPIILISILFLLTITANAAPWLQGWNYRMGINFTTNITLTNYPLGFSGGDGLPARQNCFNIPGLTNKHPLDYDIRIISDATNTTNPFSIISNTSSSICIVAIINATANQSNIYWVYWDTINTTNKISFTSNFTNNNRSLIRMENTQFEFVSGTLGKITSNDKSVFGRDTGPFIYIVSFDNTSTASMGINMNGSCEFSQINDSVVAWLNCTNKNVGMLFMFTGYNNYTKVKFYGNSSGADDGLVIVMGEGTTAESTLYYKLDNGGFATQHNINEVASRGGMVAGGKDTNATKAVIYWNASNAKKYPNSNNTYAYARHNDVNDPYLDYFGSNQQGQNLSMNLPEQNLIMGVSWGNTTGVMQEQYDYFNNNYGVSLTNIESNISGIIIYNCSPSSPYRIINFSIYSEEQPTTQIISELNAEITIYNFDLNQNKTFNFALNGSMNYYLCMNASTTVYAFGYFVYTSAYTHRYYIQNATLNNATVTKIIAYNYPAPVGLSIIQGEVRDSTTYNPLPNTVVQMQRKYVGEGVWRVVQMDKTGDYGLISFNIRETTTDYRFVFIDRQNHILKETYDLKFLCISGLCTVTYLIPAYGSITSTNYPIISVTSDNLTKTITTEWHDATGSSSQINVLVTKESFSGQTTICNDTLATSSGSIICNATGTTGQVKVTITSLMNGEQIQTNQFWVYYSESRIGDALTKTEKAIWSSIIFITIVGAGVIGGIHVAMIFAIVGLIITNLIGLTLITLTIIVGAAVLAIIISMLINRGS